VSRGIEIGHSSDDFTLLIHVQLRAEGFYIPGQTSNETFEFDREMERSGITVEVVLRLELQLI